MKRIQKMQILQMLSDPSKNKHKDSLFYVKLFLSKYFIT